jgi:hypothetical protein
MVSLPCITQSVARLTPRGSRVRSHVNLLWICGDRVALGGVPSRVRQFSLESIILPIFRAHISLIYNRHYKVLATDMIVK